MKKLLTGVAIGYSTGAAVALWSMVPEIMDPTKRPSIKSPIKEQAEDVGIILMAMVLWPALFHHELTE